MSRLTDALITGEAVLAGLTTPFPDLPPSYTAPLDGPHASIVEMIEAQNPDSMYMDALQVANDVRNGAGALADATRIGDESTGEDPAAESEQVAVGPPDPDPNETDEWSLGDDFHDAEATEADGTDTVDVADFGDADASEGGL